MRWVVGVFALALIVVVFALTTPEEVATEPTVVPPPTPATTSTSTSLEPQIGELEPGEPSVIAGALPDGTEYVVTVTPALVNEWHGSAGAIVTEHEGTVAAVGVLRFQKRQIGEARFAEGVYRLPAGSYLVELVFYDHVLEHLGEDAEKTVRASIRGSQTAGLPVLELDDPFRWARDEELPIVMETRYSTFSVRRGCSRYAAACSAGDEVQVLWRPAELSSSPQWRMPEVTVEVPE